jgi:hypothetical protein
VEVPESSYFEMEAEHVLLFFADVEEQFEGHDWSKGTE